LTSKPPEKKQTLRRIPAVSEAEQEFAQKTEEPSESATFSSSLSPAPSSINVPRFSIPARYSNPPALPEQEREGDGYELEGNAQDEYLDETLPPLRDNEGHDAWTVDLLARRSSPPPAKPTQSLRTIEKIPALPDPPDFSRSPTLLAFPNEGGVLDLVERSEEIPSIMNPLAEMEEFFALGNFTDALRMAELIIGYQPDNEQAQRCAEQSRDRLEQLYVSKIGPLDRVPVLLISNADMLWLGLDHRSAFLLSRIDGISTVEEVLDICGMPRLEGLKTFNELQNRGAIRFE